MDLVSKKVDDHTHIPKWKIVLNPPFPDSIKIEIIAKCNYKCSFCALKQDLRSKGHIDDEFLYRILNEAKDIGVKEIGMFLLGESFISKKLPQYILYAKEIGIEYVFITTNGFLCTEDKMRLVLEAGLDSIKFSFNSGTREEYKKIHGVDGFDTVLENIKTTRKLIDKGGYKINTCVSSIFFEDQKEDLERLRDHFLEFVDDFYFLPLYNQAGHCGKGGKIVGNPGRLENMVPPVPCWALFNAAKITWDGWLTACCFDHNEKFKIADLNKVSLMDAWHHEKFQGLRNEHLNNTFNKGSLCARCLGL